MSQLNVGLYGTNGHQITQHLVNHPHARIAAVAAFGGSPPPDGVKGVREYAGLDGLLADPDIQVVSLCSPLRRDQARDAILCMEAGKHVYAEKPCALTEADLDAILAAAARTGMQFREMAGTVVEQPYRMMRELVQSGVIGTVVQLFAQKCYPWYDGRPMSEAVDGGLATQVGVYAARFAEHIAGMRITSMRLEETSRGNPVAGSDCRMAVSFLMAFENGGVGSAVCNYLNPIKSRCWGYEILRIFGTEGIVESNAETGTARLLIRDAEPRMLEPDCATVDYFDLFADALQGRGEMPLSVEEELNPTRWVIRARTSSVVAA